ncbi:MAG TPA: UvrB/UvrC motif-containing protein [Dongiaceae bacterium]|nr:UvrB/UvrC motif-containing protein [Dongiaceae bacterium]
MVPQGAGKLEFERAALIRDQIDALKTGKCKKLGWAPRVKPTRSPTQGIR